MIYDCPMEHLVVADMSVEGGGGGGSGLHHHMCLAMSTPAWVVTTHSDEQHFQ